MSIVTEEKTLIHAPKVTRDRGYRRNQRDLHIRKKVAIRKEHRDYIGVVGKFDKGKVHCSCSLCTFNGYTMQDIKRANDMAYELFEEEYVVDHNNRLRKMCNNTSRERGCGSSHTQKTKQIVDMSILEAERAYKEAVKTRNAAERIFYDGYSPESYDALQKAKEAVKEANAVCQKLWKKEKRWKLISVS